MSECLPLYSAVQPSAVELVAPEERDVNCDRCKFHAQAGLACAPAMNGNPKSAGPRPGGILLVFESPTEWEQGAGKYFRGDAHMAVLKIVAALAGEEHVRVAYGLGCNAPRKNLRAGDVAKCRPYLARTVAEEQPRVVVTCGPVAMEAVTGRRMDNLTLRGGYGWLTTGPDHVPVYYFPAAWLVASNAIMRKWFVDDLQAALAAPTPQGPPYSGETEVVATEQQSLEFEALAASAEYVSFDCETTGIQFKEDFRVISVACSLAGSERSWVWDVQGLTDPLVRAPLLRVLGGPTPKGGQNVKYDMRCVRSAWGVEVRPIAYDTRYWQRLVDSESAAALEYLNEKVGMGGHKREADQFVAAAVKKIHADARVQKKLQAAGQPHDEYAIWKSGEPKAYAFGMVPRESLLRYNALDTLATQRSERRLRPLMKEVMPVWLEVMGPAVETFEQMESWGMPVSERRLYEADLALNARLKPAAEHFEKLGVNPASDPEVRKHLFGTLGLKPRGKTDTGLPSVDKESLSRLAGEGCYDAKVLMEYRVAAKMQGTYVQGLAAARGSDGRVHPNYNLDGAATGRTSCSDPNLQNIPSTDRSPEDGKLIKDLFKAPKGRRLVQVDYSQLELRVAADLSGDPEMLRIFESGEDYHMATAKLIAKLVWGKRPEDVGKAERRGAKTINFGILYGATDIANAMALGCPESMARTIREAVFGKMKRLAAWVDECRAKSLKDGVAWTRWRGQDFRRRNLYQLGDYRDSAAKLTAERGSWNTPVQGTASEYCVASVDKMVRWAKAETTGYVIGTVHDSILCEVDATDEETERWVRKLRGVMMGWPTEHGVALEVDFDVGPAWGSMEKYMLPEDEAVQRLRSLPSPGT